MDEATLLAGRASWVREADRVRERPVGLTRAEEQLFDDLLSDRWECNVRLEQERVPFGRLVAALEELRGRGPL
jgi:hypothetical protein